MMRVISGMVMGVMLATLLGFTDTTGNAIAQVKDKIIKKDKATKETEVATGLLFQVYKDKGDSYRFRILNGEEKLAGSVRGYEKKAELLEVISTLKKGLSTAKTEEEK